jgi:hypothetical protein
VAHKYMGGQLRYQIKWYGYEDEADLTWEPLENLCAYTPLWRHTLH